MATSPVQGAQQVDPRVAQAAMAQALMSIGSGNPLDMMVAPGCTDPLLTGFNPWQFQSSVFQGMLPGLSGFAGGGLGSTFAMFGAGLGFGMPGMDMFNPASRYFRRDPRDYVLYRKDENGKDVPVDYDYDKMDEDGLKDDNIRDIALELKDHFLRNDSSLLKPTYEKLVAAIKEAFPRYKDLDPYSSQMRQLVDSKLRSLSPDGKGQGLRELIEEGAHDNWVSGIMEGATYGHTNDLSASELRKIFLGEEERRCARAGRITGNIIGGIPIVGQLVCALGGIFVK